MDPSEEEDTYNHMHVVLFVKNGFGFDFLADKPCRVVVEFHNSVLASDPITLSIAPDFDCCFSWRVENDLLIRLNDENEKLTIRFKVQEGDEEEQTIGYAVVRLQGTPFWVKPNPEFYVCMKLEGVTLPSHVLVKPEVLILLTIQSDLCVNSDKLWYSAELTHASVEESEARSSFDDSKPGPSGLEQRKPAPVKLESSLFHGKHPAVRGGDQPSDQSSSGRTKSSDIPNTSTKDRTNPCWLASSMLFNLTWLFDFQTQTFATIQKLRQQI